MKTFKEFILETNAMEFPEIKTGAILQDTDGTTFYKILNRTKSTVKVVEIAMNKNGKPDYKKEVGAPATCRFAKQYAMNGRSWFECKFDGIPVMLKLWNKVPVSHSDMMLRHMY